MIVEVRGNRALFALLECEIVRTWQMRRLVKEDQIREAIFQPPNTTRAFFRPRSEARFIRELDSIQWDKIVFHDNETALNVMLVQPAHNPRLDRLNAAIREAKSFADFGADRVVVALRADLRIRRSLLDESLKLRLNRFQIRL